MFWVGVLAISILFYVLLDGFDLGVGILFGFATSEPKSAPDAGRSGAIVGR